MSRYLRKKYNKYTSEPTDQKDLGRLVIQATSPEEQAPNQRLLVEIANGISTRKTADTDSAVKALSSRLSDSDSRIVINALSVADYLLRNVIEKGTATNLRSIFESTLLPKIRRLARGLATAPGEPIPNQKLRETALIKLQEWASSRFLSGALTKHPMFAEAYREATRTPSPPTSAAADVAASKAPPAPTTSADELVSAPNGSFGPYSSDQEPTELLPARRRESSESSTTRMSSHSKLGSPPTDDGQFVAYYGKMIRTFDRLHRVQHLSLDDEGIRKLRSSMEQNLERLSRVSNNFGQPHQKAAEKAWNFARDRLGKFSDRPPSNASDSSSTISGSQPALPPYPPPLGKRNTGTRLPYTRETSEVHSWNPSIASAGPLPSATGSEEPSSSNGMHLPVFPECSERSSSSACATRALERMMRVVNTSHSLSPTTIAWTDAPFTTLPSDLFLGASAEAQHPSMAPQPCPQGHQGPPPRAGTQPYGQHAPVGAASFIQPHLQQQPMIAAHQMNYSHMHNSFPQVPGPAPPGIPLSHLPAHAQVRPHDSGNLVNAPNSYHHFANYPRAA